LGHKVHPIGFRLGVIRDWQAKWYSEKHYAEFLLEDVKLRKTVQSKYREAAISLVEIDRQAKDVSLTIHTARPGIVIGRGGQRVDEMRLYLENLIGKKIRLNIMEIRQPELDAYLVARSIAEQIERRVAYRRAMKQSIFRTIQAGAKGIKISCAGRLGNAEIARRQTMHQGQVPLHTLRADIDYGFTEAHTALGRIGVKVWIYKGEILPETKQLEGEEIPDESAPETVTGIETTPAELEEKPVEVVVDKDIEAAFIAKLEKMSAEVAVAPDAKVAPVVKPEEKAAKPVAKKETKATPVVKPEEKATKPVAKKETKATPVVKPEEKAAKPAARSRKKATTAKEPTENATE